MQTSPFRVRVRVRPAWARSARGFSLIELMIVVIIIGVIAALAMPTLSVAALDRRAYQDAGAIMQLMRSARTRAIARGGAVLVTMNVAGTSDRGTFQMYEAVTNNAGGVGTARTPLTTCKTPTSWAPLPTPTQANANVLLIAGVNLNSNMEVEADIQTTISVFLSPTNNTATTPTAFPVNVCWTPLGRAYVAYGATAAGMFDGLQATITPIEIDVQRAVSAGGGATIRSILVPPSGMARLFSKVAH